MPTLRQSSRQGADSMLALEEGFRLAMLGVPGHYPQITPMPQGSDSLELERIMLRVIRSLAELETVQPYLRKYHYPYLALLGSSEETSDATLDYQSVPPARRVPTGTRFFVRGRGKPKPYPIEDG
jgi:hypothetical protein